VDIFEHSPGCGQCNFFFRISACQLRFSRPKADVDANGVAL
jgi:hypothetical protein